jgi:hypothetical protein
LRSTIGRFTTLNFEIEPLLGDMIEKGRTAAAQFETSTADQLIRGIDYQTDSKTAAFGPIRVQGAHEHEAKEHDLPLVRQGRT